MRFDRLVVLGLVAGLFVTGNVLARDILFWDGEGGDGDWFNSVNWSDDAQPDAEDILLMDGGDATANVPLVVDDSGSLTLMNGSITTGGRRGGSMVVGENTDGMASVIDGGTINAGKISLGDQPGAQGIMTVNGGMLNVDSYLEVGPGGKGILTVRSSDGQSKSNVKAGKLLIGNNEGGNGSVSFDHANAQLGDLMVGDSGRGELMVSNGGYINANRLDIGWNGGEAKVDVVGIGQDIADGQTQTTVRYTGGIFGTHGSDIEINIRNGALIYGTSPSMLQFGGEGSGNVVANIDGPGSQWSQSSLAVGYQSEAFLNITNGGKVYSQVGIVNFMRCPMSWGTVVVEGNGSMWEVTETLDIGVTDNPTPGKGTVEVNHGGVLGSETNERILIGMGGRLAGNGSVIAEKVINQGRIKPGYYYMDELSITGNYEQNDEGIMELLAAGFGDISNYCSGLDVSGHVLLAGILDVEIYYDYAPTLGSRFEIISAGSLTGVFDVINVIDDYNTDVDFDVEYDYDAGKVFLVAVPEPASLVMVAAGVMMFGRRKL